MAKPGFAAEKQTKLVSEARNVAVSFVGKLDVGELLNGTPTVVEVGSTDLTITNVGINIVALTINDKAVIIGRAVQFKVTGGVAGVTYILRLTSTTDASPSQTVILNVTLKVAGD